MAFTTGTATDQNDMLDQLKTWLTGLTSAWTVDSYTVGADATQSSTLFIHGPGAGGSRQVYLAIQSWYDSSTTNAGWEIHAATAYSSSHGLSTQVNSSPPVFLSLRKASLSYWFFANDRRVIVVAQVGTVFTSAFMGFLLPFALPSEYPFPLYVGASFNVKTSAGLNDTGNRFIADPGNGAAYYFARSVLSWQVVANTVTGQTADVAFNAAQGAVVWPFRLHTWQTSIQNRDFPGQMMGLLRANANGERSLWPCHVYSAILGDMGGVMDGVYAVPGTGLSSGQTLTIGGRTFIAFQNVFRTTARNFMCIEEA